MSTSRVWFWAAAVATACASGCGGDDDGGGGATMAECEPSNTFSCLGSNGCRGIQICNVDRTWGSCSCGSSGGQGGNGSTGQSGRGGGPSAGDGGGGAGAGGASGAGAGSGAAGDGAAGDGAGEAGEGGSGAAGDGSAGSDAPPDDEDCDNGEDDDGDGDVDCGDDDCDHRICARSAPNGWDGPAVLFLDDLPDECPNAYDDELARGGLAATADDADCDTCSCTPSSPDCASFLNFSFGAEDDCGGISCSASVSASCIELTPGCLDGLTTAYLEPELPSGLSSCAPSGQTPSLPDAEWTEEALACAAEGLERGGCSSGSVCAPPLPDGASLCIVRAGERDCPDSGPYTERTVIYTDVDDDRSCTACSCDQDCDYAWRVYAAGDTSCATPVLTLDDENQCAAVSPTDDAVRVGVVIDGTGDCEPSGGQPQGGVTEDGPVTVCCDA